MPTPPPIDQPPVMKLIRERRKRLHLSYTRAALLTDISDARWRQLEDGYRTLRGIGRVPESAPAATLAQMARAVGVTPGELSGLGLDAAATELGYLADRAAADGGHRAEAERLAAQVAGLNRKQHRDLVERIASDLAQVKRDGK